MNSQEHHAKAEELLDEAAHLNRGIKHDDEWTDPTPWYTEAQVHATLAVAAAVREANGRGPLGIL